MPRVWNEFAFCWEYKCGCLQYQDGWDKCQSCVKEMMHKEWSDEEMDVNPADHPERRRAKNQTTSITNPYGPNGHTCIKDDGGTPNRKCVACESEVSIARQEKPAPIPTTEEVKPIMRQFEGGATRSNNEGKLDYFRFNHPLVEKVFAEYMHKHRKQADGNVRDGNNWWKGWPKETSAESLMRHIKDIELHLANYPQEATEQLVDSICASIFNLKAMLLQVLREQGRA